ncbi:type IV secretory system conjugative DNA transfer family protein [Curtobacterium sp. B18]|uniref:type IV secretory system conjugative DNA transfer family protein n=1 Tax=Curtobacterium sp. B18 TaxID=95614 RepID=UPI001651328F|nr:type IV secretion system DNA-binding domain-containing protein [Curtobacterium sp. B18]
MLVAIHGLGGSPFVTLEACGANRTVTWRLGCDYRDQSRLRDLIRAHVSGTELPESDATREVPDRAARLHFKGSDRSALLISEPDLTVRTLLAALSRANRDESVTLQLTLGARLRPSNRADVLPQKERKLLAKWREQRFLIDVRIGASAKDPDRARSLVSSAIAGLRQIEGPGVRLIATKTSGGGFYAVSLPWLWPSQLTPSELIPMTVWPVGEPPLPGVPSPHPRRLYASHEIPERGMVLGESLGSKPRPVALKLEDAGRHVHLIGPTGVGKSTLLARMAIATAERGAGLVVIDPKGDLTADILARIPAARRDDVVVLDPRDEAPVGIASLSGDPDRTADVLLGVFHSIYADNWGIRSADILRGALLSLARRGDASLVMIPTLLTNPGFRRSVTARLVREDPMGLGAFWGWYDGLSEPERQQAIGPVLNKLRAVLLRPGHARHARPAVAALRAERRLHEEADPARHLAKGQLGPEASVLLGSVVVGLLWDAIAARTDTDPSKRAQAGVYVDEVQDYLRLDDLQSAIVQARGLGVSLGLSHQHLGQLGPNLREALLGNVGSRVMFGLQHRDAGEFARMSRGQLEPVDLESLPAHEAYASLLVGGTAAPWASMRTLPLGPATGDPDALRARSRANYGVPAADTEADLRGIADPPQAGPDERIGRTPRRPKGSS